MTDRSATWLDRWTLDTATGQIGCFQDAVLIQAMPQADLDAIRAHNAVVLAARDDLRTYEAALRVPEPGEDTPETVPVYDENGEETGTEPHPAHAAYDAAQAAVAATSADIVALHAWRQGEPEWLDVEGEVTPDWIAWDTARQTAIAAFGDVPVLSVDPVEAVAARERDDAINAERERRLALGVSIDVTGYGEIPVQGRDQDQINLLALKDTARDLIAANVTAAIVPFRDGSNTNHMLTPAQIAEVADKGKTAASALYQAGWALKADPELDHTDDANWP